jgi:hypothetical protein
MLDGTWNRWIAAENSHMDEYAKLTAIVGRRLNMATRFANSAF